MATNKSNNNGRALEYSIAEAIFKTGTNASLSQRAVDNNKRDLPKFQQLSPKLQSGYLTASIKISNWVNSQFGNENKVVDRLPDVANSVADIEIKSKKHALFLSIKHNHHALKHPRPYSLAQEFGFAKGTNEDIQHRADMKAVADKFRFLAKGAVKYTDAEVAKQQMLIEVCQLCEASINKWVAANNAVSLTAFKFLVSSGFYKVIVDTKTEIPVIKIQDYQAITLPSTAKASSVNNRLFIKFNNGWVINMRIHTAKTEISKSSSQLSLKFDAQKDSGVVNEIYL